MLLRTVQHDGVRGVEVVLVLQGLGVAVLAVGLAGDGPFQQVGIGAEGVGGRLYATGLFKPGSYLRRIGLHLLLEVFVYGQVLLLGVRGAAFQAVAHHGEALEHVGRDVERQHGRQHDVHEVDHALARRDRVFLYSHIAVGVIMVWFGGCGSCWPQRPVILLQWSGVQTVAWHPWDWS